MLRKNITNIIEKAKVSKPTDISTESNAGIGSYFDKEGKYVQRRPEDNFYFIIDRIQTKHGLKLNDVATKTGVSVKTLYNIQKEYREPGEGHTTTIGVINKVFAAYPRFKKEWEEFKAIMPIDKKEDVVTNLTFDKDMYATIPVLGNWYSQYDDSSISSLEPQQQSQMLFPKFVLGVGGYQDGQSLKGWYALNSQSPTYSGVSIMAEIGDVIPGTKIYRASMNNWSIIKFKDQRRYFKGLIYACLMASKSGFVNLHLQSYNNYEEAEGKLPTKVIKDIPMSDIEYTIPFVLTVSQVTIGLWQSRIQNQQTNNNEEIKK